MPDSELNIRVDVNTGTISQLKDELKKLKTEIATMPPTSPEFRASATEAASLNARIKDLNYQMTGLSGATRQARTEKRMFRFALMEVAGGIDGIAGSIEKITGTQSGGLKALSTGLQGALGAGMGLKFGLDMLGGSFAAIAGPAGIAVGVFSLVATMMSNASEEAKKLKDEIAKLQGETDKQRERLGLPRVGASAQAQLTDLIKQRQALIQTPETTTRTMYNRITGEVVRTYEVEDLDRKKKLLELDKQIFDLEQEVDEKRTKTAENAFDALARYTDANDKEAEAIKKREEEETKAFLDGIKARVAALKIAAEYEDRANNLGLTRFFGKPINSQTERLSLVDIQNLKGAGTPHIAGGEAFTPERALKGAEEEGKTFTDSLTQGLYHATSTLAQGFTKAFKLGDSLLGQFAASMLSVFSEIGVKALIGKGLSMIPGLGFLSAIWPHAEGGWINEPVLGIGLRTGQAHSFAERGPEYVSSAAQSSRGGGMQPIVKIYNHFDKSGIATVVEEGNTQNKRLRL